MTSQRETARVLADAVVDLAGGDLAAAVRLAEAGDHAWWRARADEARVPFMVRADLQSTTVTVLRDRRDHPDPFDSFPQVGLGGCHVNLATSTRASLD